MSENKVRVCLWFDVEDYILPQSDDALLAIARMLAEEGVKASFRLVGEKARTLAARGRWDVVEAVAGHDIGYHSNLHSQHPTVAEYLRGLGWEEGRREFLRREEGGYRDVVRITGRRPTNYGQPGYAWAPQVFPALKELSIPVYICDGRHIGLNEEPFWYMGILNVFNLGRNETRWEPTVESDPEAACREFRNVYDRLSAGGGGTVSIVYHPCEWAHKVFWDAVNFADGRQPPRERWVVPEARPVEETSLLVERFRHYVKYISDLPRAEFVHPLDLLRCYEDRASYCPLDRSQIEGLCRSLDEEIDCRVLGDISLSPAEIMTVMVRYAAFFVRNGSFPPAVDVAGPVGPSSRMKGTEPGAAIPWHLFREAIIDVDNRLERTGAVPELIWAGSAPITPIDFLSTLVSILPSLGNSNRPLDSVSVRSGRLATESRVASDSENVWDWPIFPAGFRAPELLELARLGAWTLKPAILSG